MKKAIQARNTLFEIAEFFHAAAHKKDFSIVKGMTIAEVARNIGMSVPSGLRGTTVLGISAKLPETRKNRQALMVEFEQRRAGVGAVAFKKCVKVGTTSGPVTGSVEVCIDCSIRKMKCTITIVVNGTITIG